MSPCILPSYCCPVSLCLLGHDPDRDDLCRHYHDGRAHRDSYMRGVRGVVHDVDHTTIRTLMTTLGTAITVSSTRLETP